MFYAPWCGHCKKMKEPLEQAAQELKSSGNTAVIAKVDATQEGELARKYDVNGYPTLKYFKKGVAFDYKGGRETHQIVEEIKKAIECKDGEWFMVHDFLFRDKNYPRIQIS